MRSIKVLGLGFALLLGSLLSVAASAREHTTTSAVVFVAYRDDGHYYRDRDDRCRRLVVPASHLLGPGVLGCPVGMQSGPPPETRGDLGHAHAG